MRSHLSVHTPTRPPRWRPAAQRLGTGHRSPLRTSRGEQRPRASSSTAPSGSQRGRLAGIDGLRALAALSILVYHVFISGAASTSAAPDFGATASKAFNWLQSGVTLFFVLSGFLLFR